MRTDWKALVGKRILVKSIFRERWKKQYGEIQEKKVLEVAPNGTCVKVVPTRHESTESLGAWYHRDDLKLVEVLECNIINNH